MKECYKYIEGAKNLLSQLWSILKKSDWICKQTLTKCEYSKLLDNFELLVEEVEETGKLIGEFDVCMIVNFE